MPVIQGDAETELYQFPAQSFDYVILSQTLQAFYKPDKVLKELLRIGKSVIVSIPNFGYWKVRTSLIIFWQNAYYKNVTKYMVQYSQLTYVYHKRSF